LILKKLVCWINIRKLSKIKRPNAKAKRKKPHVCMQLLEASLSAFAKINFIKVNNLHLIEGITWVTIAQSRRSSRFCWVLDVK